MPTSVTARAQLAKTKTSTSTGALYDYAMTIIDYGGIAGSSKERGSLRSPVVQFGTRHSVFDSKGTLYVPSGIE